ncbi:hypothetical protein NAL32_16150 [Chryseobacterium sp. Ch-15]|uniref:Outer membrane protein beta-barrel domain-containing protein n=1 Tax=Chryseobacterium muglaense TaxID=2893752 RepID=A0A9Q3YSG6_9FLAO|nr:hypothetical protein [Chryseobacterium muglaense]MBD3906183.1 hypothetical protein [Chryseobacterium muglaense]MCC9033802.1 hypothetical protein [Chryseobacterium muglaense]MCM2555918.1 hypothetical protein [Chryseobacterium muglaense]
MKKAHYILGFLLFSQLFFAQKEKLAFYFGAELQPTIFKYQPAAHINARSYLNDRLSLGGALSFTSKKYSENFGYQADRTRSNHIILNVLAQNDFINTEKVVLSTYLSTGLYFFSLVNPDEKTTQTTYNDIDGIWVESEYDVPKKLSRDIFYNVQGGVDFSVKLATITEDKIGIYLTSRAAYQFVFGKGDFINGNQFTKPVFSLGVTFKGNR